MRSSRGVTRADLRSKLDHRVGMQANRHSCPLDGAYGFVLLGGSRAADDLRPRLWRDSELLSVANKAGITPQKGDAARQPL